MSNLVTKWYVLPADSNALGQVVSIGNAETATAVILTDAQLTALLDSRFTLRETLRQLDPVLHGCEDDSDLDDLALNIAAHATWAEAIANGVKPFTVTPSPDAT